ncbi:MAG TPA: hypothetical protein DEB06_04290, partial [Phycisphaerales bacterium]|nr:hypothetical protein [Phycisphaerales bacterium]
MNGRRSDLTMLGLAIVALGPGWLASKWALERWAVAAGTPREARAEVQGKSRPDHAPTLPPTPPGANAPDP